MSRGLGDVYKRQTETPSQDSSADGGLHLGSSFGAVEYHGITSYQWATLLLLIIIVVWLNLRYRRKSRIASDAKRGILPPRAPKATSPSAPGTRIFAGQEQRFIREQEYQRDLFMRRIDFQRRRAVRQVHPANKTGSGHWPRTLDRSRDDQKSNNKTEESQRKLLGQQDLRQANGQQRRGRAETPARDHLPAVNERNPTPAKKNQRRRRRARTAYSTTSTTYTPSGPVRRFWNWREQRWEELDPSSADRNIETVDLAGDDDDNERAQTPARSEIPRDSLALGDRPKKRAGQDPLGDGAQDEGVLVQARQERVNSARRQLFGRWGQAPVVENEPNHEQQDDNNDPPQPASDEYATAESQVGGEDQIDQQHHDRQDAEPNNNAGVHFWGDTESESEDEAENDGFSCGLPEIDDWPNEHYTPCQEERLSNTITHAMRFIMTKDDNDLCEIEEDTLERRRRRTVLDLAESNRVADLCNEIRRHAKAIRQERKLHEEIFTEVDIRQDTGRGTYPDIREKSRHIRKSREIFTSNNYEDIRWRQKFCNAKDLSDFTRSRGTRVLTTPPPPDSPEPEKTNAANTSSDSGASFTVIASWNDPQQKDWEPQIPVHVVRPMPASRQEDSDKEEETPIIL